MLSYFPIGLINVRRLSVFGGILTLLAFVLGGLLFFGIAEVWLYVLSVLWVVLVFLFTGLHRGKIMNLRAEKNTSINYILFESPLKERIYFLLWGGVFTFTFLKILLEIVR